MNRSPIPSGARRTSPLLLVLGTIACAAEDPDSGAEPVDAFVHRVEAGSSFGVADSSQDATARDAERDAEANSGGAVPPRFCARGAEVDMLELTVPERDTGRELPVRLYGPRTFDGECPVVVGVPGGCKPSDYPWDIEYEAQNLASDGYVVLLVDPIRGPDEVSGVDPEYCARGFQSGLDWMEADVHPMAARADPDRMAIFGFSLGGRSQVKVQHDEPERLLASVIYDHHAVSEWGDTGTPACHVNVPEGQDGTPRTPNVPTLGLASDSCRRATNGWGAPEAKLSAFRHWRDAGVPVGAYVFQGSTHGTFTRGDRSPGVAAVVHYYTLAWLDLFVYGDEAAAPRLERTVAGDDMVSLLSDHFRSGLYLPGRIDCDDLRSGCD